MSWWVSLVTKVDGHEIEVGDSSMNYTHNCNPMIRDAGLTQWPYEVDGWKASYLGALLREAIENLEAEPAVYQAMNPPNGWGSYDTLLPVLRKVRDECLKYPSTTVRMSA